MTSQPHDRMTLLMLVFDDDTQAHQALQELKALNKAKQIKIKAAALVTKSLEGKVKVKPKILALIEPLWIQDFIQALLQSSLSPAPRQIAIGPGLDREHPAHPLVFAETLVGEPPAAGSEDHETSAATSD